MNYDIWKTTTPLDRAHVETCNCDRCHANHRLSEQADHVDFLCCTTQRNELVRKKKWCLICNSDAAMKDGKCWENHAA